MLESNIRDLPLLRRGKVRDIYGLGQNRLLIVSSDRLSAFDVVFAEPIPGKGRILNQLSRFWFHKTHHIVAHHLLETSPAETLSEHDRCPDLLERSAVVVKTKPLPVEIIVRGYLAGSGWLEYQKTGTICDIPLPPELGFAAKLPDPIFTPSTKASDGAHDRNISFSQCANLIGSSLTRRIRDISLRLYQACAAYALENGIIIADTKFEFGLTDSGRLLLIDELATPDSSRFWALESWRPGAAPTYYDKQIVRDYLNTINWDKKPPAPRLPPEVIKQTIERYAQIQQLLMHQ